MSAPMVAGAIALLFQRDPLLTQDKLVALLQAGAHAFRGAAPFQDQGGPGELDVLGSLDALDQMHDPARFLPSLEKSWITLSADFAAADASTPLTVIVELRTADGQHRADMLGDRVRSLVLIDGAPQPSPPLTRKAPGLWYFTVTPPRGLGGSALTVGASFDGQPIVAPRTVPIAVDIWSSEYAASAKGGCAMRRPSRAAGSFAVVLGLTAVILARRRAARDDSRLRRRRTSDGRRS